MKDTKRVTFPDNSLAAQASRNIEKLQTVETSKGPRIAKVITHRTEPGSLDAPYRYSDWRNW